MRTPAGALPVVVALMIGLLSGCNETGAGGGASTGTGPKSSASTDDRSFTLEPSPVPDGEQLLLTRHGFGPEVASRPIKVDGSYSIYVACRGGSEVTVVSRVAKSETKVICSGYPSRLRYLTESTTELWEVKADKEQEWVFRMVDAVEPK
jgi:hypothetical protein